VALGLVDELDGRLEPRRQHEAAHALAAQLRDDARALGGRALFEKARLGLAQHLDAPGVDVLEKPGQREPGLLDASAVDDIVDAVPARHEHEVE